MSPNIQARLFCVSGAVQGVGYRFFVQRVAERLCVAGYAKNLRDGRVEVYAVGSAAQLAALRDELLRGSSMARVADVKEQEVAIDPRHTGGFSIEHDD